LEVRSQRSEVRNGLRLTLNFWFFALNFRPRPRGRRVGP